MGRRVETEIIIQAAPEKVWEILSDFASHRDWNPFITEMEGQCVEGSRIRVSLRGQNGKNMEFKPILLKADPARELCWRGSLPIPGLFVGEHVFQLEETGSGCRLRQFEDFSGLLVPLMPGAIKDAEAGFKSMNEALKVRAEGKSEPYSGVSS